ncbi:MAG: DEAD/DEAH box helicase [Blastocatellia bacterium]
MSILLADTLIASVRRLDSTDAKRIWDFLGKLFEDPTNPGISLERIVHAKDKNLWSGRISQNLRAIIHKESGTHTVLYAGNHDEAYDWAKSRKIERHIVTGALQIVESPELIEQKVIDSHPATIVAAIFDAHKDDYLISLGLPPDWLPTVRKVISEDILLDEVLPKLPEEVAERLLKLAAGEFVTPPTPLPANKPVIESQDTRRRFFKLESNEELIKMLVEPLSTWAVFLHPSQQKLATGNFNGAVKITGSAGTGKTVVALHRARHLAKQSKRVFLTTYVTTLCNNLQRNLAILCSKEELSKITVGTVHQQAMAIINSAGKQLKPIDNSQIKELLEKYQRHTNSTLQKDALMIEWENVIQSQGISSWEEYRSANRSGRGTPLTVKERKQVWQVFERVFETFQEKNEIDWSGLCKYARELLVSGKVSSPFDAVVVDEVQDLGTQELMLLAHLAGKDSNNLMLVGDGGQRIYANKFTLKALGIDVRGRSHILKLNYRTTEQIRRFADKIINSKGDDLDGGEDSRKATRSLLTGVEPDLAGFDKQNQQMEFIVDEINSLLEKGLSVNDIAIFARTSDRLTPIETALRKASIPSHRLQKDIDVSVQAIHLGTMHRAKGLEFKVAFVVDVSDELMPLASAIKATDSQAQEDTLLREQQLLYVSITRARDQVFISWVGKPSRFINNFLRKSN